MEMNTEARKYEPRSVVVEALEARAQQAEANAELCAKRVQELVARVERQEAVERELKEHVAILVRQLGQKQVVYEDYLHLLSQQKRMSTYLGRYYGLEIQAGHPAHQGDAVDAALYWLGVERKRWRVRLRYGWARLLGRVR